MSTLPNYNNCVLDLRFWQGTIKDFSSYGNDGTFSGCHWEKRGGDYHVKFEGTDKITVPDSASLQLTEGTLIAYGDIGPALLSDERILSKRGAAGIQYEWLLKKSGGDLAFYDGTTVDTVTAGINDGTRSIAVTFSTSEVNKFYVNGMLGAAGVVVSSVTAVSVDLLVGAYWGGGYLLQSPLKGVLIYNTVLSPSEIAQIHEWVMKTHSTRETKRHFVYPSSITGREPGLVAAWDMKPVHGKVIDKTGNGNDGTITPPVIPAKNALQFQGGHIKVPNDSALDNDNAKSVVVAFAGASGYVFGKSASGGGPFAGFSGSNFIWGNGAGFIYAGGLADGNRHHIVLTYDGTGSTTGFAGLKIYVDGAEISVSSSGSFSGFSATGSDLYLGSRVSGIAPFDGAIYDIAWYGRALSPAEVKSLYQAYAHKPYLIDTLSDATVSVAAQGGGVGATLENTIWKFGDETGRFKISQDNEKGKVIECATAGLLYAESKQAYGTWEFDVYKGADTNAIEIMLTASAKAERIATIQNGYAFVLWVDKRIFLQRMTSGTPTSLLVTTTSYYSSNTWYSFRVTRRYDGLFYVYIKGGSFGDAWTLVDVSGGTGSNPVTDNTITSSKYVVLDLDAGDKISNFHFYRGVV